MRRKAQKNIQCNSTVVEKARELGLLKLATSGLTSEDAALLRFDFLSAEQTQELHPSFKPVCSLKINYLGVDGDPLSDWPGCPPFYRLRYLESPPVDFGSLDKKPQRYTQAPNTAPVAYYPANVDWSTIASDADRPLIITEGELKAAAASKAGFPTVGLGGVYNWRAHKLGLPWLPSLDLITWPRRNVYVCFDSDYRTNPMVCAALREFSEALQERGAYPHMVSLPELEGLEKVGLDDFLVHAGDTAVVQLRSLLASAEPLGLARVLWSLNDRYVYVHDGFILNKQTGAKVKPDAFRTHTEATKTHQERSIKADGTVSYKPVSAAASWLSWPLRSEVTRLTYAPGYKAYVKRRGQLHYNIWPGWGVLPVEGDVTPFLDLVDHLYQGAEPAAKEWFLRWCAYPLQHPGTKLFTSSVVFGVQHGTGKSFLGYTLGRIYGRNFTEITKNSLHGNHNEWAEGRQFVLGDDVTGSDKRSEADFLKKLITQREAWINPKHIPAYTIPDCINYLFTANQPDAFFLEDNDRRFFVHEVVAGPLSEMFYADYELWLDTGGASAVFAYLLQLDLSDFNPAAPAFRTAAKERMIANVQSDLGSWVRQLLANPNYVLRIGEKSIDKDLFTSRELLMIYDPAGHTGTTAGGLGRELARAGVRQVTDGRPLRLADGSQGRYFAIRNAEKWIRAQPSAAVKHLDDWQKGQSSKGRKF